MDALVCDLMERLHCRRVSTVFVGDLTGGGGRSARNEQVGGGELKNAQFLGVSGIRPSAGVYGRGIRHRDGGSV